MLLSCYGVFLSELLRAAAVPMAPSSAEQESLSGGEASGGYGSAPGARSRGHARSLSLGMDDAVGYCEATEEDERQARLLTRRLALDDVPPEFSRFVKLEGPDEVAVIVPHTLHFGAVEHLDYTVPVQEALAVQASESPMTRPTSGSQLASGLGVGDRADEGRPRTGIEGGDAVTGGSGATPSWVVWLSIMLTGLFTGLVSVVLTNISVGFGNMRLQEANELLELNRPLAAGAVWITLSIIFCSLAAFITVYYAPQAASTGIPETKAFLNGCDIKGAFSLQTFVVKVTGVCMVIASGAPAGVEGPMVHIGAMVASYVVQTMEHVGILRGCDRSTLLTHLVTCGVASGISAAFNSPIGGVLFVVEDLAARWLVDAHLILQCFVSSFFSQLVVAGAHIGSLLVQTVRSGDHGQFQAANLVKGSAPGSGEITGAWYVADVPLCILMGAGIGALLSFSTAAATVIARVRKSVMSAPERAEGRGMGKSWRRSWSSTGGSGRAASARATSRVSEIVAAVFPVALVAVLAFVLPMLFDCRVRQDHVKEAEESPFGGDKGAASSVDHRMFVRFTCRQGQYNDMASLLLPSLSGSFASTLSHLYSRDADEGAYGDGALATLAVCFYFFPLFIIGCSFPFGLFVPNLVFGSAAGRLFGRFVARSAWVGTSRVAHPTTYAVLGAGAALGGWTRMAIAISAIMLEQTGNMDSVILMMVTVLASRLVAGVLTPHSFTDEVIALKGYQVLEPREPPVMAKLSAGALCTRDVVALRPDEDVASIVRALVHTTHSSFPVCALRRGEGYDEDRAGERDEPVRVVRTGGHEEEPELLGLVARSTLLDILEEMVNARRPSEKTAANLHIPAAILDDRVSLGRHTGVVGADELGTVPAHVPASRVYRSFALMGARRVLVVESGGGNRLAGIVTRGDLLEAEANGGGRTPRGRQGGAGARHKNWREGALLTTPERPARLSLGSGGASRASRTLPATVTDE